MDIIPSDLATYVAEAKALGIAEPETSECSL